MEKALKFEKSYVRMLGTIRKGDYEKALRIKNDRIKAQRSGFDSERKIGETDTKPSDSVKD